jgi:hypothetical protein
MSFWQGERCGEVIKELEPGNVFGAEGNNVEGGLLAVHEAKSPGLQLAHKRDQRHFRGIGCTGEHRLCEKSATERHAIESADQLPFLPGFNGMGVSEFV